MQLKHVIASASALVLVCAAGFSAATLRQGAVEPTAQHKWMHSHVGTWDATFGGMMAGSKGVSVLTAGPGGLWLVTDFKADMGGMPFHGMEVMGYDPESSTFTTTWMDSSNPKAQTMTGKFDKATKKLTMRGKTPGMDGELVEATHVTTYTDENHMSFDMSMPGPDGSPMSVMTIEYVRRK